MKNFFITLTLIVVISLVSAMAYVYFSTKSAVDTVIDIVRPFASITYQSFSNPMDGSISIHDVSIAAQGKNVDIGSIELQLNSVFDYFNFEKKISSGEIPPKLQLKINHLSADFELLKNKEPEDFEQIASYIQALGCGDIKKISHENMSVLGYSEIDGSIKLNFEYSKLASEAKIETKLTLHGMGSYEFKTSIPNIKTVFDFSNEDNKIESLKFIVQDLGYNNNLIEYCTKQSGLSTETYINQHLQKIRSYLADADVSLSEEIFAAYRSYFVDQATLTFSIKPASAVNLEHIDLYQTKDWANILGLTVYVNDTEIKDLAFAWDKKTVITDLLDAGISPQTGKQRKNASNKPKLRKKQPPYVEIPINDLNKYVRSYVRLETIQGKSYKGLLKRVTANKVILLMRLKRGKAEIPVSTKKISKAFIYQKGSNRHIFGKI